MASSFHWLNITLVCVLALEKSEWRVGTDQAVASVPPQLCGLLIELLPAIVEVFRTTALAIPVPVCKFQAVPRKGNLVLLDVPSHI